MKILCLHDGGTGCAFYRMLVPLEQLGRHGHDVTFASGSDKDPVTLSSLRGYDVIVSQRHLSHSSLESWRRARDPLTRLVYETDDDVFSITADNYQAYNLYNREDIRDAVMHGAEVADLVTVTTPHLARVMAEHTGNQNVKALRNCIPGWLTEMNRAVRSRPAIGWQGGASHGVDVGLIASPVRRFLKRFPGWDLRLGGTDYRPTFKAGDRAVYSDWIPVYENAEGYFASVDFDIGLAPLLDTEFSRSKSDVKVLEYGALGIPSIASDCEVYRNFITHGENGFLVRHDHEWLKYLSILASDDELRLKMGEAAREAARYRTIERNWQRWETAYRNLFPAGWKFRADQSVGV